MQNNFLKRKPKTIPPENQGCCIYFKLLLALEFAGCRHDFSDMLSEL